MALTHAELGGTYSLITTADKYYWDFLEIYIQIYDKF